MTSVRSAQLAATTVLGGTHSVYTVPAGKRTIVHTFHCFNGHGAAEIAGLYMLTAGGSTVGLVRTESLAADGTLESPSPLVLNVGDQLEVVCGAGGSLDVFAAGSELLLP